MLLLLLLLLWLLALTLGLGGVVVVCTLLLCVRVSGRLGPLLIVPRGLLLLFQRRIILLPLLSIVPRCVTRRRSSSIGAIPALLGVLLTLRMLVVSMLLIASTRSRIRVAPAVDSLLTLLHLQLLLVLALASILLLVVLGCPRLFLFEVGLQRLNLFEVFVSLLRHLGRGLRL